MNTPFSVYDTISGKILRTGSASTIVANLQAGEGERVLLCWADSERQYIIDGVLVDKPDRPSQFHEFNYETKHWELNSIAVIDSIKQKREALLTASDWTQLPDVPPASKALWVTYRQALRDITDQVGYPITVVWPDKPS